MSTPGTLARDDTVSIGQYVDVLRRRKWWVILPTLLGIAAALAYTFVTAPTYTSNAKVMATVPFTQGTAPPTTPNMSAEAAFVTSDPVARCASLLLADDAFRANPTDSSIDPSTICSDDAMKATPLTPEIRQLTQSVSTTIVQGNPVMTISFSDESAKSAQAGAQAFALSYIQNRIVQANRQVDTLRAPLLAQQKNLQAQLDSLDEQYAAALKELRKETQAVADAIAAGQPPPPTNPATQQTLQNIQSQQQLVRQQLSNVQTSLLAVDPAQIDDPELLLPAGLPGAPSSPKLLVDVLLGLFAGLAIGISAAFIRERQDKRLLGRMDLATSAGVPVIAVIPKVKGWRNQREAKLVTLDQPHSVVAESYRALQTSVAFVAAEYGINSIMVASPSPGDGKSTTAANLAVVLAEAGRRVVLISADLRRPRVHEFFHLSNQFGLANVLAGEVQLQEAILDPGIRNLRVVPSGPVPSRPAELLLSDELGKTFDSLRDVSDFLIIDTAPLLGVSDALALGQHVDGVLLVADAKRTRRGAVVQAQELLRMSGAKLFGAVLNRKSKYSEYTDGHARYQYHYQAYTFSGGRGQPHTNGEAGVTQSTRAAAELGKGDPLGPSSTTS